MIRKPEDSAVVKALPLEHRGRIVQRMGEDVHIGLAPWNQLAVKPDPSVAIVVRAFLKHDLILAASRVRCKMFFAKSASPNRKSVVSGQSVSVRVKLGGSRP